MKKNPLEAKLARALADYANLERRFAGESASVVKFATASLIERLLSVRDHLALAERSLKDASLKLILGSLDKILADEGLVEINAAGTFNPETMECQELVPGAKDQVIELIRPGYTLHGRVLRTARVSVGNGQINKP